ncbi:MAG: hypothetical protein EA357_10735 [Micavibrio sp.]|nr:MAG: hypothetical protein EA357_10735 [Micavibrio sp.]
MAVLRLKTAFLKAVKKDGDWKGVAQPTGKSMLVNTDDISRIHEDSKQKVWCHKLDTYVPATVNLLKLKSQSDSYYLAETIDEIERKWQEAERGLSTYRAPRTTSRRNG